jgi:salicylate hydroxylase
MARGQRRAAVVGAGIGGLAAAVSLSRSGLQVTIYEQAAALGDVGAGLHLAPNGTRVLHRWGLTEQLRATAVQPAAMQVRDWASGRLLARWPLGDRLARHCGAPYYTISRTDLHQILAGQLPARALQLGRQLTGLLDHGDGVQLAFADGGTADADIAIGADGIHSVVRRVIAGPDAPVFSGYSAFRGLVPASRLTGLPPDEILLWPGETTRLLCYPVSGGRQLTFVAVVPGRDSDRESWSSPGDPAELAAALANASPSVKALGATAEDTRRWALYDREPLPSWGAGRITLLGDAAHPMLPHQGQGASQAIEDAYTLAHFLTRQPGPAGLRRYEELRRPHTARVQAGSRGGGSLRLGPGAAGDVSSLAADASWIHRYDIATVLDPGTAPDTLPSAR